MKFWPRNGKPSIAGTRPTGTEITRARRFFSWGGLGAALLGVMFARWVWVLFAPAGAVMPPALPEASEDAGRIFGTAHQAAASAVTFSSANIKLIGVFANPVKGFAVLQIDGKQLGVALGAEVRPGMRLVETHPNYVVLEQGGARSRLDLSAPAASSSGPPPVPPAGDSGTADALQHQLDAASGTMPAEQMESLQHQINLLRGEK
ncbi:MAG TPA: type II secretion system protein N [Gallionellaceae bacterium]|nr:type II secretion system protein N [Gallionellaceae bacterium]